MAISCPEHGKLLLTPDLLQRDGRFGLSSRRLDDGALRLLKLRFPPIDDVVSALDHIASREFAA